MNPTSFPVRIVSGGQTGVDQAALSVAIQLDMEHGGWCPRGRLCETGVIPDYFELIEMPTESYAARTRQNVIDSDATLILHSGQLTGGTLLTKEITQKLERPLWQIDLAQAVKADLVRRWLQDSRIHTLNVAGPRESSSPGLYQQASKVLNDILAPLRC